MGGSPGRNEGVAALQDVQFVSARIPLSLSDTPILAPFAGKPRFEKRAEQAVACCFNRPSICLSWLG